MCVYEREGVRGRRKREGWRRDGGIQKEGEGRKERENNMGFVQYESVSYKHIQSVIVSFTTCYCSQQKLVRGRLNRSYDQI